MHYHLLLLICTKYKENHVSTFGARASDTFSRQMDLRQSSRGSNTQSPPVTVIFNVAQNQLHGYKHHTHVQHHTKLYKNCLSGLGARMINRYA